MSTLTAILGELLKDATHIRVIAGEVSDAQELCNVPINNVNEWLPHIIEYGRCIDTHRIVNTRGDTRTLVIVVAKWI